MIRMINEDSAKHPFFKCYRELWKNEPYRSCLTIEEKCLYGILANQYNMFLSYGINDSFIDDQGKTYMTYLQRDIADYMNLNPKQISNAVKKLAQFKLIDVNNIQKPENKIEEINLYYVYDIPEANTIDTTLIQEIIDKKAAIRQKKVAAGSIGGKKSVEQRKAKKDSEQNASNNFQSQAECLNEDLKQSASNFKQNASEIEAECLNNSSKVLEDSKQNASNNQAFCHSNKKEELKEPKKFNKEEKTIDDLINKDKVINQSIINDPIPKFDQSFWGSAPKYVEAKDDSEDDDQDVQDFAQGNSNDIVIKSTLLSYEELQEKIKAIAMKLSSLSRMGEYKNVVENILGAGKKVMNTTRDQCLQLQMILDELETIDINDDNYIPESLRITASMVKQSSSYEDIL